MTNPIKPADRQRQLWNTEVVQLPVILTSEQHQELAAALAELLLSSLSAGKVTTNTQEGVDDAK
jgi:hypothetical protein